MFGRWEENGEWCENIGEGEGEEADLEAADYSVALGEGWEEEELGEHGEDAKDGEENAYLAGLRSNLV